MAAVAAWKMSGLDVPTELALVPSPPLCCCLRPSCSSYTATIYHARATIDYYQHRSLCYDAFAHTGRHRTATLAYNVVTIDCNLTDTPASVLTALTDHLVNRVVNSRRIWGTDYPIYYLAVRSPTVPTKKCSPVLSDFFLQSGASTLPLLSRNGSFTSHARRTTLHGTSSSRGIARKTGPVEFKH